MPEDGFPLPAEIRARMASPNNPLKARARELGLTMIERERIPSPRRAHECTEYARAQDRLEPFHAALLRAYWSDGKDIHDWGVLTDAATQAGIDVDDMRSEVESGAFRDAVDERVQTAHRLGIHAVPTFLIADRLMVQGAQTLDVFRRAMQQLGITPR
jgi:predicted DsbA family dithiol-disulfide isomerase